MSQWTRTGKLKGNTKVEKTTQLDKTGNVSPNFEQNDSSRLRKRVDRVPIKSDIMEKSKYPSRRTPKRVPETVKKVKRCQQVIPKDKVNNKLTIDELGKNNSKDSMTKKLYIQRHHMSNITTKTKEDSSILSTRNTRTTRNTTTKNTRVTRNTRATRTTRTSSTRSTTSSLAASKEQRNLFNENPTSLKDESFIANRLRSANDDKRLDGYCYNISKSDPLIEKNSTTKSSSSSSSSSSKTKVSNNRKLKSLMKNLRGDNTLSPLVIHQESDDTNRHGSLRLRMRQSKVAARRSVGESTLERSESICKKRGIAEISSSLSLDSLRCIKVEFMGPKQKILPSIKKCKPLPDPSTDVEVQGVKKIDTMAYSSCSSEDEYNEIVPGKGYSSNVRTLCKDVAYLKKKFPGVSTEIIENALIEAVPKEEHVVSAFADMYMASSLVEACHKQQLEDRKNTLRHTKSK